MIKKICRNRNETKDNIGLNIKTFRTVFNFSLDDIAFSTTVSKAYLSQLENKQYKSPSIEVAYNIWKPINQHLLDIKETPVSFEAFCFGGYKVVKTRSSMKGFKDE